MTIKELRELTNMTQKDFGEYLNIPHRTIQNWETGHRNPPEYVTELIKHKIENEKENIMNYSEMKKEYGKVEFEGKEYALAQNAYLSPYSGEEDTYIASAVDVEGNQYKITWEFTDDAHEAIENNNEAFLEDESNMCDWENPYEVQRIE